VRVPAERVRPGRERVRAVRYNAAVLTKIVRASRVTIAVVSEYLTASQELKMPPYANTAVTYDKRL